MTNRILSCDWGTSNFRLRLIDAETTDVLASCERPDGIDRVSGSSTNAFATYLGARVAELSADEDFDPSSTTLWISGMASSSIGWRELPYARVPFALNGRDALVEDLGPLSEEHPISVRLVSGLRTENDVLRGEETEALGILAKLSPEVRDDCVLVLPGTHSKHLRVRDDAIVDFRTFMTGELFELLRTRSILRHTVADVAELSYDLRAAFYEGVARDKHLLLSSLFSARTGAVLHGRSPRENGAFLSGLLIGHELDALRREHDGRLVVAAAGSTSALYERASVILGLRDRTLVVSKAELVAAVPRAHALLCKL